MWKWLEDHALDQLHALAGFIAKHGPPWLPHAARIALAIVTSLLTLIVVIESLVRARKAIRDFLPGFTEAERQRNERRRKLCKLLENRMDDLNRAVQWSDETYTDLEAEVESEGRRFYRSFLFKLFPQRNDLRREKSLASAIANTSERLVVLEGPAGCGKTVALRHVVLKLARAAESWSNRKPIALYVNLKTLARRPDEPVNAALIEKHVRGYTNELGYPDFDPFFTEELKRGREEGSMIFLFDSFDEIPEILSATDANESIREYGKAVDAFLGGLGSARAVVASRPFRGPRRLGWPVFRVLPLTPKRQEQFIRMSKLGQAAEMQMLGELPNARLELQTIAENPLFLRLLCGHVRIHAAFPANVFEVFETFAENRLQADAARIAAIFGVTPLELRGFAEQAAFTMHVNAALGLSPATDRLIAALAEEKGESAAEIRGLLDALVAAGFGTIGQEGGIERFSFGHRRLQEYFATAVVLREPDRLPPAQILLDGRWRETAVTLLQSRPPETLTPLLDCATETLERMLAEIGEVGLEFDLMWFPWPEGVLHLLGLLQDGLAARNDVATERLREAAGWIVIRAFRAGTILDQKWAIESAGITPGQVFETVVEAGLSSGYEVLRDPAYRQAARLVRLPQELEFFIQVLVLRHALWRDVQKQRAATYTHLRRLPGGERLVSLACLFAMCADLDLGLCLWPLLAAFAAVAFRYLFLDSSGAQLTLAAGMTGSFALMLSRVPGVSDDHEFLEVISRRSRFRYPVMAASAVLAIALTAHTGWPHGMTLAACALLGCLPPLLIWVSLTHPRRPERHSIAGVWFLLPLVWLWDLLNGPWPSTLGKTLLSLPSRFVRWIAEGWLGVVGTLFVGLGVVAVDAVGKRRSWFRAFLEFVLGGFVWLGILVIVGAMAVVGFQALHDQYLIARSGARRKIGLSEFLEVLLSLYRPGPHARFLRTMRRGGKIEPSDEVHRAVAALLLVAQSGSPERAAGVPELSDKKKLKAFASRVHRSPVAISELARLVEQLQNTGRVG